MKPVTTTLILITLLVELGVAAAWSSSLTRSKTFRDLLMLRQRTLRQTGLLLALICVPLGLGVEARLRVPNFLAADLSLETTILIAILFGPLTAMAGGAALALPALLHGEFWALPVNLVVAFVAGAFSRFADSDEIWSFSPLLPFSIYRGVSQSLRRPKFGRFRFDQQILLLVLIVALRFVTSQLSGLNPRRLFQLHSDTWWVEILICLASPVVIGIPLKIWNQVRIERKLEEQARKLEEQTRLLLEARLDALQRQINPHFLFNTLNSITSLVRSKPELAREMIVKLANILRTLLKERDAFVPFSEELTFTDDYLDIEVVRFGEKLKVVKQIAPETLGVVVPSMLLQPLLENSIKHGLEPRIDGGTVTLRSRITSEGELLIEVEDDGVGIDPARTPSVRLARAGTGIGMRNVRERMQVLFGEAAHVEIESRPGRGTKVVLTMPVLERAGTEWGKLRATPSAAIPTAARPWN